MFSTLKQAAEESINSWISVNVDMQLVCSSSKCDPSDCVELTNRELSVCNVICGSAEPVSFTQVKEATDLHQEIVSRVVRRLAIYGLVTKVEGRYKGNCR